MKKESGFGRKELYSVILLAMISLFLFADQNLMAPNLKQIGNEFGFTAAERDIKLGGNISLIAATTIVMAVGGGAIFGGFIGGLIGNKLYNKNPKYLPLLCGSTTLLGIIPMAVLLNLPPYQVNGSVGLPVGIGLFTGFLMTITGPNVKAMLLNVNTPETRGSIFSLFNLTDDLGKGFGPVIISMLIVAFGRLVAFNIANLFWLVCGVLLLFMVFTFPKDEAALQKILALRAKEMK